MDLKRAVEDYLPSKQSKVLLGISLFLASTPFLLPGSVVSEINWQPTAQLLLLKLAISLSLLLIGACAILLTEINARLKEATEKAKAPVRDFNQETGTWIDRTTQLHHCIKCDKPIKAVEAGWYCVQCHITYKSPEFIAKQKEDRRIQDERIKQHNRGDWMGR